MMMSEIEAKNCVLNSSLIAKELNLHEREILRTQLVVRYFSAGEEILSVGSLGRDELLVLANGQIRVAALVDEEYVDFTLEACGDIARIASFVGSAVTRVEARIDALTDTVLVVLQRYQVEALLYKHPQMVYYLMRGLARYAHRMARHHNARGEEIVSQLTRLT
jgi:signal-transduction protein with cAMP-binding, CBS, and nucleotidyltransferase domain